MPSSVLHGPSPDFPSGPGMSQLCRKKAPKGAEIPPLPHPRSSGILCSTAASEERPLSSELPQPAGAQTILQSSTPSPRPRKTSRVTPVTRTSPHFSIPRKPTMGGTHWGDVCSANQPVEQIIQTSLTCRMQGVAAGPSPHVPNLTSTALRSDPGSHTRLSRKLAGSLVTYHPAHTVATEATGKLMSQASSRWLNEPRCL